MKKMKGHARSLVTMGVVTALALGVSTNAVAAGACSFKDRAVKREIAALEAIVGQRIVAIGRVDSVSQSRGVSVLGFVVRPSASDDFQVGDYAAVIDWSRRINKQVLEVRPLSSRYVPGASEVYLKARLKSSLLDAQARVGSASVDLSRQILAISARASSGSTLAIRGIQPNPGGVILSNCASALNGSMGTGRIDGSMGTGRLSGSMGTGRIDGSMGTGRTEGSMGTGRIDGSMGTGRLSGSMGTGRTDGSMGTGRLSGSMGTGRTDGSMGTGRLSGSMGTGRIDGSMGTGRTEGSMGTGRLSGSMGTGRTDGSMGTGRTEGSMGTGRIDGSMGTGRIDGSMGTGR
jgi:hypothetical protein